ncbi:MAG: hypothetical protein ACM3PZ_03065 [Bacillota bacterium]
MNPKNSSGLGIDLNKYEDREGLTVRKMHFGLWLSENRPKITRGLAAFLIIASAVMFVYSTYNYIFYFLEGKKADEKLAGELTTNLVDTQAYRNANTPQPLAIGEVSVFGTVGRHDFLVPLKNPNLKHFSNFEYCLVSGDDKIACGESFILPASEKNLLIAGIETVNEPSNVRLEISNLFWQRLSAHEIQDWSEYRSERMDVALGPIKYESDNRGGRNAFHDLSFTIKNTSAYSYLQFPLDIILYNGSLPSAVNSFRLDNFLSGESREVSVSWASAGERVTRAVVEPDVNILDKENFLPYRVR